MSIILLFMKNPCNQKGIHGFKKWQRPTLPQLRSTIGATRLNFSVRDGKRWITVAIDTF